MRSSRRKWLQQVIAMIVIAAVLQRIGLTPVLIIFFFLSGFLIWLVVTRSSRREAREVFEFYIAADEILRDQERQWYGFEILEVAQRGERVLSSMPDPPPLVYFSLGALQYRAGDYEAAAENLAALEEVGFSEEHHRRTPSPALRHYVELLRSIEREPAIAPLALGAVRSLERGRRAHANSLLTESRARLEGSSEVGDPSITNLTAETTFTGCHLPTSQESVTVPRSISEVLHDIYQDEKPAC
jgi:hypothetical protein